MNPITITVKLTEREIRALALIVDQYQAGRLMEAAKPYAQAAVDKIKAAANLR